MIEAWNNSIQTRKAPPGSLIFLIGTLDVYRYASILVKLWKGVEDE